MTKLVKIGPDAGKVINKMIDGIFNIKGKIIHALKKIYNFARMKYSIYVNREKRVNRIKEKLANKKEKLKMVHINQKKTQEQRLVD